MWSLEDIDNFMNELEPEMATTSMVAEGASLIPGINAVAIPIAGATNILGAGIDVYQGIRSAIKGDWGGYEESRRNRTISSRT